MLQPCKCKTLASIPKSSGIVRASGCCPPRDSWIFLCFRVHESVQGQVSVVLSRWAHKGSTQQILSDWTSQISKPAWIQFDIIAISRWNHSDEVFKYFPTMYLQCIYTIPIMYPYFPILDLCREYRKQPWQNHKTRAARRQTMESTPWKKRW